jgi:hypothetical protein
LTAFAVGGAFQLCQEFFGQYSITSRDETQYFRAKVTTSEAAQGANHARRVVFWFDRGIFGVTFSAASQALRKSDCAADWSESQITSAARARTRGRSVKSEYPRASVPSELISEIAKARRWSSRVSDRLPLLASSSPARVPTWRGNASCARVESANARKQARKQDSEMPAESERRRDLIGLRGCMAITSFWSAD